MAFQTGTATDVHNMLQLASTFLAANGWTVDRDAVVGSGRELLVSNGESFFQMRSGTTETLSALDVPLTASNVVETGIWVTGSTGFDNLKGWNRQPGRIGRYIDGTPIPLWLDTDGNTGSFDYWMYAWTTPTPEFYLVVEYAGTSRYTFLGFGEMEQIHDWGFTRGIPFVTASRDSYRNTSAVDDVNYGARGPFGNWGQNGTTNFFARWKPSATPEGLFQGVDDPDNSTTSPWRCTTDFASSNQVFGWTARHMYGMATWLGNDLVEADPSTFNGADVLIPFYTGTQRLPSTVDGQASQPRNYNWSFFGVPNHARFVDMTNLLPGDTLVIGGDTWQVWPNHYIGQAHEHWDGTTLPAVANMGFAVRQN